MGPLAAFGVWLADRAARHDSLPFQDVSAARPPAADTAGIPTLPPGGAGHFSARPGAGLRANNCTDDTPWHRCVNESGQPSNLVCHASEHRRNNQQPKEVA